VSDSMPIEAFLDGRVSSGLGGHWYGVYPALVNNIKDDPDGQGRVRVTLPWSPDPAGGHYEAWARVATLMGGNNRGTWFIPDVNDEVLIVFEGGDPRRPYVIGGLWNGTDAPPQKMDGAGNNYQKIIRSRNGVKFTLDDSDGKESLTIETPGGQKIVLSDGPGDVKISDSNGNSLEMGTSGIAIISSGKVTINATTVEITAGQVSVTAGMSTFSGVVQADTVIANSIVSASYTPGAGNIW
jgi:uncharacterized protein involved in type VI secretion and phage assembly